MTVAVKAPNTNPQVIGVIPTVKSNIIVVVAQTICMVPRNTRNHPSTNFGGKSNLFIEACRLQCCSPSGVRFLL